MLSIIWALQAEVTMYATSEDKTNGGFAMIEETLKRVKKANAYLLVTKRKKVQSEYSL